MPLIYSHFFYFIGVLRLCVAGSDIASISSLIKNSTTYPLDRLERSNGYRK